MVTKILNRDSLGYGRHKICKKCNAQVGEGCHDERGTPTVAHSIRTYIEKSQR